MNREIKFRGRRKKLFNRHHSSRTGKWVYGYYFKFPPDSHNKNTFIIEYKSGRPFTDNLIAVDPETIEL